MSVATALPVACLSCVFAWSLQAATVTVHDAGGQPLSAAMVTRYGVDTPAQDLSDQGYPPAGVSNRAAAEISRFTGPLGRVRFDATPAPVRYRVRKPGYSDSFTELAGDTATAITLQALADPVAVIEQQPANTWLAAIDFGGDRALKKQFQLNCGFLKGTYMIN